MIHVDTSTLNRLSFLAVSEPMTRLSGLLEGHPCWEAPIHKKKPLDRILGFSQSRCVVIKAQSRIFLKQVCQDYFESQFSGKNCKYISLPDWVAVCHPAPEVSSVFYLSPVTPGCIKGMLRKCSSKSAPGPDGITYHHLKKLLCTHHSLATIFSKILISNQSPSCWCQAKTILLYKKSDSSLPNNFRPIALRSCIGKLFHKIIAHRLEAFLISNNVIDTSFQKGFLTGVNGVMEHSLSVKALLENARVNAAMHLYRP